MPSSFTPALPRHFRSGTGTGIFPGPLSGPKGPGSLRLSFVVGRCVTRALGVYESVRTRLERPKGWSP